MRIKLGIPLTLKQICEMSDLECGVKADIHFSYVCTDSREYEMGDLFWSLKGNNFNTDIFTQDILNRGGIAIGNLTAPNCIYCEDTREALLKLAHKYKELLPSLIHTVAITGSVGKSTTKEFSRKILATAYKVHATEGNYNNEIGVPITLLTATRDTEIVILECGMNHFGELARLSKCIEPDIVIITNIGTSHIGNLGDREAIAKAKMEILKYAKKDCKLIVPYGEQLLNIDNAIKCSTESAHADAYLKIVSMGFSNTRFDYTFDDCKILDANCRIGGMGACLDLAYAITGGVLAGIPRERLIDGISTISTKNTRQKVLKLGHFSIIDDSYNSSVESLKSGIELLKLYAHGRKSVLLTDILELGNHSKILHTEVGKLCAEAELDAIYFYGNYASHLLHGALESGYREDKILAISNEVPYDCFFNEVYKRIRENETVYAKGSHNTNLREIIQLFIQRYENDR